MKKRLLLLVCVLLLAVLLVAAAGMKKEEEEAPIENAGISLNAPVKTETLTYQGQEYPMRRKLQTVLLIGTDGIEGYDELAEKSRLQFSYQQADFLVLVVLDAEENTAKLLQLNRETVTEIPWLDLLGNYGGTFESFLCLAFNYGDGGRSSCLNTVEAVSSLLFDAPIDHYIQMPMSGIRILNDLVGGVPVTIQEDMTVVDPAFQAGAKVTLRGSQAEKFVRARMELENDTNLARMERQRQYLDSFQVKAREAFHSDSRFMMKMLETLSEYLQSDMTAQQLSDFVAALDNAQIDPIRYAEGRLILGEEHYEFYPDEASLWEMVKEAYCEG